jgi:hypothetical protein
MKREHPIAAARRLGERYHAWQGAGLRKAVRLAMRQNPRPPAPVPTCSQESELWLAEAESLDADAARIEAQAVGIEAARGKYAASPYHQQAVAKRARADALRLGARKFAATECGGAVKRRAPVCPPCPPCESLEGRGGSAREAAVPLRGKQQRMLPSGRLFANPRKRNPDPLADRIAERRRVLAKVLRGEMGDPPPGQMVDHEFAEFVQGQIARMEREAAGDAREMTALARESAAQDAARSFHSRHAMNHAEALARFIRDAGVTTARAWQSPGESRDARVYLPGGAGYLSVSADGSVNETERGKQVFYPSSLYRNMREAVKIGRQSYRDSFRERMERHDAERVAAVAKVRGNPGRRR